MSLALIGAGPSGPSAPAGNPIGAPSLLATYSSPDAILADITMDLAASTAGDGMLVIGWMDNFKVIKTDGTGITINAVDPGFVVGNAGFTNRASLSAGVASGDGNALNDDMVVKRDAGSIVVVSAFKVPGIDVTTPIGYGLVNGNYSAGVSGLLQKQQATGTEASVSLTGGQTTIGRYQIAIGILMVSGIAGGEGATTAHASDSGFTKIGSTIDNTVPTTVRAEVFYKLIADGEAVTFARTLVTGRAFAAAVFTMRGTS